MILFLVNYFPSDAWLMAADFALKKYGEIQCKNINTKFRIAIMALSILK